MILMSEEIVVDDISLRIVSDENIISPEDHNNLKKALKKIYEKYIENYTSFKKHPEIPYETDAIRTVKTGDYVYAQDEQSIINILRKWNEEISQRQFPSDKVKKFRNYLYRLPNVYAGGLILSSLHNNKVYAVKYLYDIVSTKLILTGYKYRRKIVITNNTNIDLYDYQVLIYLDGDNPDDYDTIEKIRFELTEEGVWAVQDVRFTDSDGVTELPYWVEDWNTSELADQRFGRIWVKIPHIPANSSKTIYMYYGNDEVSTKSNGNEVWDFYEDFHTIDFSRWSVDSVVLDYAIRDKDNLLHPLILGHVLDRYFLSIRDVDTCWDEKKGFHLIGYTIPQNKFRVGFWEIGWDNQRSSNIFRWGSQISNTANWDREIDFYVYDLWAFSIRQYGHFNIGSTSYETGLLVQNGFFPTLYFVKDQDNIARIIQRSNGDETLLLEESTTETLTELLLLVNKYSTYTFCNEVFINGIFIGKYVYPEPSITKYSEEKL